MTVSSPMDDVRAQYEALPLSRDPRDEAIRLITGTPSHILEVNHPVFRAPELHPSVPRPGGGRRHRRRLHHAGPADRRPALPGRSRLHRPVDGIAAGLRGRAKARGLRNIRFITGSILDLPTMPIGQFDYIDCTGVLHHMPDPVVGMGALAACCSRRAGSASCSMANMAAAASIPAGDAAHLAPPSMALEDRLAMAKRLIRFPADHQPVPPPPVSQRPRHRRRRRAYDPAAQLRSRLHGAGHRRDGEQIRTARRRLPGAGALRAGHL